jgi:predicted CoA-binding protein
MRVAILGASDKPERYSYLAFKSLQDHGHTPLPVHPKLTAVEGVAVSPSLEKVPGPVDTLTVYVSPEISAASEAQILNFPVSRVIFNPGTENPALAAKLRQKGRQVEEACTLVLLKTGQF